MKEGRSLIQELIASPYFVDMSVTFGMTALTNYKYATDKYVLPKAMLYQFLVKMVTTDLVEEGWMAHETKEIVDIFTSSYIFIGSYNTLYEPLKSQFALMGTAIADALSKAVVFGGIPIPNLISIGNLANIIQGKDNQCSGDVPHSPPLDNKYPSLEAGVAYTSGMFAKYIATPAEVANFATGIQHFMAGGAGYSTSKVIANFLNSTPLNNEDLAFEFALGGTNHIAYKFLTTPLETTFTTYDLLSETNRMPVIAGLIECTEQLARQNKEVLIEYVYEIAEYALLAYGNLTSYESGEL